MLSAKFPMLQAEKSVPSARLMNDPKISGRASSITIRWQEENADDTLWSATMADGSFTVAASRRMRRASAR